MVFLVGVIFQLASAGLSLLIVGRAVAGLGVGGVSAIVVLYMSEIAPRKVRGAIVSAYQFFITVGKSPLYFMSRGSYSHPNVSYVTRFTTRLRRRLRYPEP